MDVRPNDNKANESLEPPVYERFAASFRLCKVYMVVSALAGACLASVYGFVTFLGLLSLVETVLKLPESFSLFITVFGPVALLAIIAAACNSYLSWPVGRLQNGGYVFCGTFIITAICFEIFFR